MIAYMATINDDNGVTILALSLSKDTTMKIVKDYIDESGVDQWMNLHKKDDEPPAEAVYTKRDLSEDVWVVAREIDE